MPLPLRPNRIFSCLAGPGPALVGLLGQVLLPGCVFTSLRGISSDFGDPVGLPFSFLGSSFRARGAPGLWLGSKVGPGSSKRSLWRPLFVLFHRPRDVIYMIFDDTAVYSEMMHGVCSHCCWSRVMLTSNPGDVPSFGGAMGPWVISPPCAIPMGGKSQGMAISHG